MNEINKINTSGIYEYNDTTKTNTDDETITLSTISNLNTTLNSSIRANTGAKSTKTITDINTPSSSYLTNYKSKQKSR